ncbi:hypothetical protein ACET3Z_000739 [Daucus carota]
MGSCLPTTKTKDAPQVFVKSPEPTFTKLDPFKDKMKSKIDDNEVPKVAVSVDAPGSDVNPKPTPSPDAHPASWANVLKKEPEVRANFKYYPIGEDKVVEPPLEVTKTNATDDKATGGNGKANEGDISTVSEKVTPVNVHSKPVSPVDPAENENEGWTEVKRKTSSPLPSELSPSPPRAFTNLKNVDEIDKKLTKSQKKRLRRLKGSSSPPTKS